MKIDSLKKGDVLHDVHTYKAGNTTMHDAGYEFEPVERSTSSCYEVRCTRAPRTAADIEADGIRKEMAAMAAKQKELEARLRGLGL